MSAVAYVCPYEIYLDRRIIPAGEVFVTSVSPQPNWSVATAAQVTQQILDNAARENFVSLTGGSVVPTTVTYFYDTFTDTAGTLLTAHTPDQGGAWAVQPGTTTPTNGVKINSSGRLYTNDSTASVYRAASVAPTLAGYVEGLFFAASTISLDGPSVTACASGTAADFYMWRYVEGTGYQLYQSKGGTLTQLGLNVSATWSVGASKALRLDYDISGASPVLTGSADGQVLFGPYVDSSVGKITSAGGIGLRNSVTQSSTTGKQVDSLIAIARTPVPVAVLPKLKAAIARVKAGTGRAIWALVGDSTTVGAGGGAPTGTNGTGNTSNAGTGGNTVRAYSWSHQSVALFATSGIPARADAVWGTSNINYTNTDETTYNPNLSLGSGWTVNGDLTIGGRLFGNTTTTNALTFTPDVAANAFDIYYVTEASGGGTVNFTDASGTIGTFSTQTGTLAFVKATISRSASSTSPIAIAAAVAGSAVRIAGIVPYDTTSPRLELWNMGSSGWQTSDWLVATYPHSPFNALATLSPDLATVELGVNDINAAVAAATFQSNTSSIVGQLKTTGSDVQLIKTHRAMNHSQTAPDLPNAYLAAIDSVGVSQGLLTAMDFNSGVSLVTADFYDSIHLIAQGYAKESAYAVATIRTETGN